MSDYTEQTTWAARFVKQGLLNKARQVAAVAVRLVDAPPAVQAAIVKVAGLSSISGGDGLSHTISGRRQHPVDPDKRRGCRWRACS